jgi:hypothetical protein
MADDAVCCEPLSMGKFPDKQGKNRKFHRFRPILDIRLIRDNQI